MISIDQTSARPPTVTCLIIVRLSQSAMNILSKLLFCYINTVSQTFSMSLNDMGPTWCLLGDLKPDMTWENESQRHQKGNAFTVVGQQRNSKNKMSSTRVSEICLTKINCSMWRNLHIKISRKTICKKAEYVLIFKRNGLIQLLSEIEVIFYARMQLLMCSLCNF